MNNIFHIDMDAFFVSIEISKNKNLQDKPVAVGGIKNGSVISTANYTARNLGIKSAMSTVLAKSICPNLIILEVNQEKMQDYNNISHNIFELLKNKISKTIEIGSIDEWYIDISNSKWASLPEEEIIYLIKNEIKKNFKLNCTIGCSYNKIFAKIATNLSKPNGSLIINKQNYKNIIWNLKINQMPYIVKNILPILENKNIIKIKDLANYSNDNEMIQLLGNKWIEYKRNANGEGNRLIISTNNSKSIGRSTSFYQSKLYQEILTELYNMTNYINSSLLKKKIEFRTITISFKMTYKKNISKSKSTDYYNSQIKLDEVRIIYDKLIAKINVSEIKVCALNVSVLKEDFLIDVQQSIYMTENQKSTQIKELIPKLNKAFNKKVFYLGKEKESKK